ncbi:MAG TPA: hypothetical protein VH186_02855 [Chloroflexia bacterium]|nr:hypothetical protein [Chloroflexia bacterium]
MDLVLAQPWQNTMTFSIKTDNEENNQKQAILSVLKQAQQSVIDAAQPLTVLLNLVELMSRSEHLDDNQLPDMQLILEQAFRLKEIVHELQRNLLEAKF